MTLSKVTLKYSILFMIIILATGCREKDSVNPYIRNDVYSAGISFMNLMMKSAARDDQEIDEKIDDQAYELKVVCIEKNDLSSFSEKEISYIDTLGEIRVAYDDLVFSRNPKYKMSEKEQEKASERFEQLVSEFDRKYTQ